MLVCLYATVESGLIARWTWSIMMRRLKTREREREGETKPIDKYRAIILPEDGNFERRNSDSSNISDGSTVGNQKRIV